VISVAEHSNEMKHGAAAAILKDAEISVDEFIALLPA
jgi:hypothetical protein